MMKKPVLWALFLAGITSQSLAQDPNAEKYAGNINAKITKKHLSILASDKFEGRETGKRGAEMAAAYIAREFKKLKLIAPVNGSYLQQVSLIETSMLVHSFELNKNVLSSGKDFQFSGSGEARTIQANELLFIAKETESELKENDISGKVVLIIQYGQADEIAKRLSFLKRKKPALILAVNTEKNNSNHSHNSGVSLSVKNGSRESFPLKVYSPPVVQINPEIANLILKNSGSTFEKLAANNAQMLIKAELKLSYGPVQREVLSSNVLGYLEGTDLKDELLVYSAHYDHIGMNSDGGKDKVFNGADDDGSGTSGVLAIAKAFAKAKKEGNGPRRSILFLMFTGEEKNLLGSEYYSLNPVFPMANTITNLNIDMIGRTDFIYRNTPDSTNYLYLVGTDKLSIDLHRISDHANAVYTKLKLDYRHNAKDDPTQIYFWSDHYNFAKNGVPVIFYYNGKHEDYHKGSDEVRKINFNLLSKRAQLAYYTGWDLVNRDKRPVVDVKNNMPATR
ncbi:M28 family peptidase [Daejeonella rubra]|nr:M28 family peptidase [Daejeonella rubra]